MYFFWMYNPVTREIHCNSAPLQKSTYTNDLHLTFMIFIRNTHRTQIFLYVEPGCYLNIVYIHTHWIEIIPAGWPHSIWMLYHGTTQHITFYESYSCINLRGWLYIWLFDSGITSLPIGTYYNDSQKSNLPKKILSWCDKTFLNFLDFGQAGCTAATIIAPS